MEYLAEGGQYAPLVVARWRIARSALRAHIQ